jgi:hypothetical protein
MKIDLNEIDQTQFMTHPHVVNGETLWLVQPQFVGAKWTQANKHLRSSVWNNDGELVSAGFPKFTNWGENPDNFPVPTSLKGCNVVEKLDGSLLIVSKYKGNFILRTRGTVDGFKLDNGFELEEFSKNPFLTSNENSYSTWNASWLFEWVSPHQRIVLSYGDEPQWILVGAVDHRDYSLMKQEALGAVAEMFKFKRPAVYSFPSVDELMKDVEQWKGKEGVVIYSNKDQTLHKVKGLWYLALHRMKESLSSFDKVVDVWFEQGQPTYQAFERFITDQFDFELWSQIRGEASRICDGAKEVEKIVAGMKKYVNETLLSMGDPNDKKVRGQQARHVISSYGITNRANFVFTLLDGKELGTEDRKKLLYQVLKK